MQEKILKILSNHSILPDAVGDIIFKNKSAAFTIDIGLLELNKIEAEKIAKICENEIKKSCLLQKVTIILTSDKNIAKTGEGLISKGLSKIFGDKKMPENIQAKNFAADKNSVSENKKNLLGAEILPVMGVKKIIAIASAKGGVGKSSLAVNIAISLQKIGHKVALVDADIYGPSIPHLMGLTAKPASENGLIIPLIAHNVKCISVGSLIDENAAGVWRGPMITKILYQLIRGVNWQYDGASVDFMIIDMPPGTGDVYLSLAEKFPLAGVAIVSTPQSLAVIDVVRSIDCLKKLQIPILGIIQNMAYLMVGGEKKYLFGKDGAKNLAAKLQINFLGEVPIEQEISNASEARVPVVAAQPHSEIAMVIGRISEGVVDFTAPHFT